MLLNTESTFKILRIAKLVVAAILATVIITDQRAWAQNESEPEVVFSYAQARVVALRALQRGNFELAGAMSSVLLVNDPNDAEALLVRALLLRATGQLDVASDAAARAYRNSDNPELRFDAAMLAAGTLARQERYIQSQVWLRRADQAATDEPRRAAAAEAHAAVGRKNPLSIGVQFTLKPSNNVNNGAETTELEIGGLPFRVNDSEQQLGAA